MNGCTVELPAIKTFIPNSLNEWDGRLCAIIAFAGCNWRCAYCHGWRLVTGETDGPDIPASEVLAYLEENEGWVDGIVVSGGEPTLQPHLVDLLRIFREHVLEVKIHTNGSRPDVLAAILAEDLVDCVALDFKSRLDSDALSHVARVDADAALVRESYRLTDESGVEVEAHTTLCPAFLSLSDLPAMAEELSRIAPRARWIWQQYNPEDVLDPVAAGDAAYQSDEIRGAMETAKADFPEIELRGLRPEHE
jgi:pyruvate formate lyase activating enzyme